MNKRRLLKLADLLEADAANRKGIKFDLHTIIDPGSLKATANAVPMSCGTTACAMGLAALSGAFKRAGGLSYEIQIIEGSDGDKEIYIHTTLDGKSVSYDDAAASLFDIGGRLGFCSVLNTTPMMRS